MSVRRLADVSGHKCVAMRVTYLPSFHLWPKEYGVKVPSDFFIISTTGLRIPGTAAEASTADHITQSGAVR